MAMAEVSEMAGFGNEILILRGPSSGTDLSVAGNDGTLTNSLGVVADTDAGGVSAFAFDATNKRITLPSAVDLPTTGNWSFGCWYKTSQESEGSIYTNNANQAGRFDIKTTSVLSSTYRTFLFGNASPTSLVLHGSNVSNNNNWQMLVATRDGDEFAIYDNGTRAATATVAVTISTNSFSIGGRPGSDNKQSFSGRADDIRRSNSVWSDAQILAWYNAGRGYDVASTIQTRRRRDLGGFGL